MQITKEMLKRIIKEELENAMEQDQKPKTIDKSRDYQGWRAVYDVEIALRQSLGRKWQRCRGCQELDREQGFYHANRFTQEFEEVPDAVKLDQTFTRRSKSQFLRQLTTMLFLPDFEVEEGKYGYAVPISRYWYRFALKFRDNKVKTAGAFNHDGNEQSLSIEMVKSSPLQVSSEEEATQLAEKIKASEKELYNALIQFSKKLLQQQLSDEENGKQLLKFMLKKAEEIYGSPFEISQ